MENCKWTQCTGEAHKAPAEHDHCMICIPYWSDIPVCPKDDCGKKLRKLPSGRGKCDACKKMFTLNEEAM